MSNDKLNWYYGTNKNAHAYDPQIKRLRSELEALIEENNGLVAQIWDNDYKLNNGTLAEPERHELMVLNQQLNEQLTKQDYDNKVDGLRQQIIALEMELYGHSDLNSNSPYRL